MKGKNYPCLTLLAVLFFLTGCVPTPSFTNLTNKEMERNPSGIYTISMAPCILGDKVIPGTEQAYIVIDGQRHCMEESCLRSNIWDYAYRINPDQSKARYYFEYSYEAISNGHWTQKSIASDLYCMDIVNQYVISMTSERGLVGSRVAIVGEGFSPTDKVFVGGMETETHFCSKNSIEFLVPPLEAGCTYEVEIQCCRGNMYVGEFLLDASEISILPNYVDVCAGQRTVLLFSIDREAPCGGVYVSVETDVPQGVILPEVIIPAGARTVSVPLEGGIPCEGRLYIGAAGFKEIVVPVTVR